MENLIIIAILAIVLGLAGGYVYRAKRSGQKCIGCPYAKECSGSCGCGNQKKKGSSCH